MEIVFLLTFIHEEEGVENPIAVFSSKENMDLAIENMKIDYGNNSLKKGVDFNCYEIPFDKKWS